MVAAHARQQGRAGSQVLFLLDLSLVRSRPTVSGKEGGRGGERKERKNERKNSALRNSVLEIAGVRSRSASLLHAHAEI